MARELRAEARRRRSARIPGRSTRPAFQRAVNGRRMVADGERDGRDRRPFGPQLSHAAARPQASPTEAAESRFVQGLIPGAELVLIPGDPYTLVFSDRAAIADAIRAFLGVERTLVTADTVLSSVLFTDIVGSTEKQASLVIAPGTNSSVSITSSSAMRSSAGAASRTTQQATGSTRPSTDRPAQSAARSTRSIECAISDRDPSWCAHW